MSLLFCDGFDDGMYNQKWTRSSAGLTPVAGRNGNGAQMGNQAVWRQLNASEEHATIIMGGALRITGFTGWTGSPRILGAWSDNHATEHISMGVNSSGIITVFRGSSTLASTSGSVITAGINYYYIELKVVLHDTTGSYELRVNGTTLLSATNIDTKNAGTKTVIDSVQYCTLTGTAGPIWDDVYICNGAGATNNDFLGDIAIETLYPNGAGSSTQWTPSSGANYAAVDETGVPNTTDYVTSSTAGQKDTYTFDDLTRTSGTVKGVQVSSYAHNGDTGTISFRNVARSGGNESTGQSNSVITTWTGYEDVFETDPNGGGNWTIAAVNSAEFGVQIDP
jgi:hypothetical protein